MLFISTMCKNDKISFHHIIELEMIKAYVFMKWNQFVSILDLSRIQGSLVLQLDQ